MRPMRAELAGTFSTPRPLTATPRSTERVFRYVSNSGREFEAHVNPWKDSPTTYVEIYERKSGKFTSRGWCYLEQEEDSIYIWGFTKVGTEGMKKPNWSKLKDVRGIELLRPVLDIAIREARKKGISKIRLDTYSIDLVHYYGEFGFVIEEIQRAPTMRVKRRIAKNDADLKYRMILRLP